MSEISQLIESGQLPCTPEECGECLAATRCSEIEEAYKEGGLTSKQHFKALDEVLYIKEVQPLYNRIQDLERSIELRDVYIGGLEDAIDKSYNYLKEPNILFLGNLINKLQALIDGRQVKDTWL